MSHFDSSMTLVVTGLQVAANLGMVGTVVLVYKGFMGLWQVFLKQEGWVQWAGRFCAVLVAGLVSVVFKWMFVTPVLWASLC